MFLDGAQGGILGISTCQAFGGRFAHLVHMHAHRISAGIIAGHVVDVEEGILGIGEAHHGTADVRIAIYDSFRKVSVFITANK